MKLQSDSGKLLTTEYILKFYEIDKRNQKSALDTLVKLKFNK